MKDRKLCAAMAWHGSWPRTATPRAGRPSLVPRARETAIVRARQSEGGLDNWHCQRPRRIIRDATETAGEGWGTLGTRARRKPPRAPGRRHGFCSATPSVLALAAECSMRWSSTGGICAVWCRFSGASRVVKTVHLGPRPGEVWGVVPGPWWVGNAPATGHLV